MLRDYTRQLPDEYLAPEVFDHLSTDAQVYLKCTSCRWEHRLNPSLAFGGAKSWEDARCRACGEDRLAVTAHLLEVRGSCGDCGAAFELTTHGFTDLRCAECLSGRLDVSEERITPAYPLRFGQLGMQAKSRPWGEDVDEDLEVLVDEPKLTQLLPQRSRYLIPTALFCHRLYEHGGYENRARLETFMGGDARGRCDLAALLNLEGLLLREYFKQTGEITAGLDAFRVLSVAAATSIDGLNKALREHNVAMAAYSVLTRVDDDLASALAETTSLRQDGCAAATRALEFFETSGEVEPELRAVQRTRIHHLLGDLLKAQTDDPESLRQALGHYDAALADVTGVPEEFQTIVRAARAETLLQVEPPESELRADATKELADFLEAGETQRAWSDKWLHMIIQARNYDELGDTRTARKLLERAAAIAHEELELSVDEVTIRQRGERFVLVFDELARLYARLGHDERALDAVETVRGASVRVHTMDVRAQEAARGAAARRQGRIIASMLRGRALPHTRVRRPKLARVLARVRSVRSSLVPDGTAFVCLTICRSTVTAIVVIGPKAKIVSRQWPLPSQSAHDLVNQPPLTEGPFRERRLRALCRSACAGLIEPLLPVLTKQGISRIAISAPAPLASLPFEAFPLPGDGAGVLADRFQVLYLPALSLGVDLAERADRGGVGSTLLVGYRDDDLPLTLEELRRIELLWKGRVRTLFRESLTKKRVLAELTGQYDHIHFAAHGTFEPSDPLSSALHLVRDPNRDSHRLTAADLAQLKFPLAPVVTLSACSSALTSYGATNDCTGLTGSFLQAGARCVIGSRWPVYDATAMWFMVGLHERLAEGSATAQECLHDTQTALRRDGLRSENWAAFSYLGIPA